VRLYIERLAPNARRVRVFLAEKGVEPELVEVDMASGEHKSAAFLAKNPLGQVPVLELDDGLCIAESISICRYLDETCSGPRLFGATPRERAVVDMWLRRVELRLFSAAVEYGHHSHPYFADTFEQNAAFAAHHQDLVVDSFALLDRALESRPFVAGEEISIADVTAYTGVELAKFFGIAVLPERRHVRTWSERMGERPSSALARYV